MAYKIYLLDNLSPIEWSQAVWRLEGAVPTSEDCDRELIHDVMLRHLPQDGLIADAGCGAGRWPIHLRRLGYRVVGIDISPEAGRAARAEDSGLPITVGDVRRAREELFVLPGMKGKIAAGVTRWVPWLVCGEVTFVARAG